MMPARAAMVIWPEHIAVRYQKERTVSGKSLIFRVLTDETGGEVMEWAIVVGLIVVAAIVVVTSVGTKVLAKWTSIDASIP